MVRSVLVAVLAVSALASCKGGSSDAPRVAASAPAGKVVELAGKVEATRSGKTRPLAVGAEVYGDDQIATAADATVTIELFHNNARWAVTSNKQARVDSSLAWGLAKQQATSPSEHNSAAAGREAERTAAETRATSETARREDSLEREEAMKKEAAPAPSAQTTGAAPGGAPDSPKSPPPPPPPPPKAKREMAPLEKGTGIGDIGTRGRGGGVSADVATDVDAGAQLAKLVGRKHVELKACLEADVQLPLTIFVRVDKGKVVVAGKPSAEARTCMQKVIEKLDIASVTAATKLELR